jgi:hypothetical protein
MKREFFERWHPDAAERVGEFQLALDSWGGTGGFRAPLDELARTMLGAAAPALPAWKIRTYLDKYAREHEAKFDRRQLAATYFNLVRRVGRLVLGYLFRQGPTRKYPTDPSIEGFLKSADGRGMPWDTMLREVARRTCLFGTCPLVVDQAKEGGKAGRAGTFVAPQFPQMLRDWDAENGNGKLQWAKLIDEQVIAPSPDEDRVRVLRATRWFPDHWERWIADAEDSGAQPVKDDDGEGPNPTNEVPIVLARFMDPVEPTIFGSTPMTETALLNRELFNVDSERREHRRGQVFAILVAPPLAGKDQPSMVKVGTENILTVPADAKVMPVFIAPPATVAQTLAEDRGSIRRDILQLWGFGYFDDRTGGPASAASRLFDVDEANAMLVGVALNLAQTEREALRLYLLWDGKTPEKADALLAQYTVEWPRSYDVRDLARELDLALKALDILRDSVSRAQIEKDVRNAAVQLDETQRKASDAEIDALAQAARIVPPPPPPGSVPGAVANEPTAEEIAAAIEAGANG